MCNGKLKFTVLSLFPEIVQAAVSASMTGRALEKGLFDFQLIQIRAYADNPYGKIDDSLFGGGRGMLMQCEAIYQAWLEATKSPAQLAGAPPEAGRDKRYAPQGREQDAEGIRQAKVEPRTIYLSPKGKVFRQDLAAELSREAHLILLCGHYEGVDQRVLEEIKAEEISLGDFVLTGGELAASVMIDAIARLLPGVLPAAEAHQEESHNRGLLECRHYTKPASWRGREVPPVLLSGHHAKIAHWRQMDALWETAVKRADMFDTLQLTQMELLDLIEHIQKESHID